MNTHQAYKYRIYPKERQRTILNQWCAACRLVRNAAIRGRTEEYRDKLKAEGKEVPFWVEKHLEPLRNEEQRKRTNALIPLLAKHGFKRITFGDIKNFAPELAWITETPEDSINQALRKLTQSFDEFFKGKKGYPKYASFDKANSIEFRATVIKNGKRRVNCNFGRFMLTTPKCWKDRKRTENDLGPIAYERHKKFYGLPKTVVVKSEGDEWYACLTVEKPARESHPNQGEAVGVDIGVAVPFALSDGRVYGKDEGISELQKALKKEKRKFSRKESKASNRRKKLKKAIAAKERRIARRRKMRNHAVTTEITRKFKYIAIEDLKVSNMTKSAKGDAENPGRNVKAKSGLNREMLNVAPYMIRSQLEYKAKKFGGEVIAVNPAYTSQTCSECGHVAKENRKVQDRFICVSCGFEKNADVNAAKNILARAMEADAGLRKAPSESRWGSATLKDTSSCYQPSSLDISIQRQGASP